MHHTPRRIHAYCLHFVVFRYGQIPVNFTHILRGYFICTSTTTHMSLCQWVNLKDIGKVYIFDAIATTNQNTTKPHACVMVHIVTYHIRRWCINGYSYDQVANIIYVITSHRIITKLFVPLFITVHFRIYQSHTWYIFLMWYSFDVVQQILMHMECSSHKHECGKLPNTYINVQLKLEWHKEMNCRLGIICVQICSHWNFWAK